MNILLLTLQTFAQENLIYNGSFEEYISCPTDGNVWNGEFEKAYGWWSPSYNSIPDYFNSCSNTTLSGSIVGVPSNYWGYQEAFHGNAYVNLSVELWSADGNILGHEYIQTKTLEPLLPCYVYNISFYISLANYSSHHLQYIDVGYSSDSTYYCIDDKSNCNNNPIIDQFTTIHVFSGGDTINWIKCEAEFTVQNPANYITIGSFKHSLADTFYLQESYPGWYPNYYVTYYLDSVSLTKIGETENCESDFIMPNVFTPNNDGINDFIDFGVFDNVTIINRWGSVILIMDSQSNFEWHGKNFREEDLPDGIYFYVGEKAGIQQKGSIQLIR